MELCSTYLFESGCLFLIWRCVWVWFFFEFISSGVHTAFWICKFIYITKFGTFFFLRFIFLLYFSPVFFSSTSETLMTWVLGLLVLSHSSLRLHFLIFFLSVRQIRSFLVLKLSSQILSSHPFFHCAHLVKLSIRMFCLSVLKFPLEGIPWWSND